jgi:hypothetical protein
MLPADDRFRQCAQVQHVFALLGRGCVAFYPRLVDLSASVTAALLLGQCLYWTRTVQRQEPDRNGWFWKTSAEWHRETGLTRREQDSARCRLRALGLLTEQRRGMPAKRWFRLDLEALGRQLGEVQRGPCDRWLWDDTHLNQTLGQPVVYWRRLHDLTGSVSAALYLSRVLFWQRLALQQPRTWRTWFHRPVFHSQQMLRLGRRQQEHARATLRALGLIKERLAPGLPPRLLTRVDLEMLAERLALSGADRNAASSPHLDSPHPDCSNPAVWSAPLRQTAGHQNANQRCTDAPSRSEQMRQPWLAHSCIPHIQGITAEKPQAQTLRSEGAARVDVCTARRAKAAVGVLQFPSFVLPEEQPLLAQIVGRCPDHAQTILDELAGQAQNPARRMAIGNPLAYARALTHQALSGGFIPEAAIRIAASRARRMAEELQRERDTEERRQREAAANDPLARAAAEAKRAECMARIHALLAPRRASNGLRA